MARLARIAAEPVITTPVARGSRVQQVCLLRQGSVKLLLDRFAWEKQLRAVVKDERTGAIAEHFHHESFLPEVCRFLFAGAILGIIEEASKRCFEATRISDQS